MILPRGWANFTAALPELALAEASLRLLRGVTINGDQMVVEERCCARRNDISMAENRCRHPGQRSAGAALLAGVDLDGDDQKGVEETQV